MAARRASSPASSTPRTVISERPSAASTPHAPRYTAAWCRRRSRVNHSEAAAQITNMPHSAVAVEPWNNSRTILGPMPLSSVATSGNPL
jgi:hypothetical protein